DAGNAFSYSAHGTTYVNFLDEWAVLSQDKDAFAKNRDFMKQLIGAKPSAPVAVVLAVKNLVQAYGTELDAAVARFEHMPAQANVNPQQMVSMMKGLVGAAKEVESLAIAASSPDNGLLLSYEA